MSASNSTLTAKQQTALKELRANISDIQQPEFNDYYLQKWLRARSWDVQKAEKMLRDNIEWRKNYEADKMLDWNPPEVLLKYCRGAVCGCDKEGYPVYMELLGKADFKGIFFSASKKDILRFRTYIIEEIIVKFFPLCSKKAGKKIDRFGFVMDMEGVGFKHLWKPLVDTVLEWMPVMEANYPEILTYVYIVNVPTVFPVLYNLVKPLLQEHTRAKIQVLGSNWKQTLLKVIDADQLPVYFGGTQTAPSEGPPFAPLPMGGEIPQSYYLKSPTDNVDLSQYTTVTVNPGQSLNIEVDIDKPNSVLRWNFWTNAKDVAFGIYQKLADNGKQDDMEMVVSNSRVNSHIVPEAGSLQCSRTGTYVVRFDNSYSWVSSKKLSYHLEVLLPDADSKELSVSDSTVF